MTVIAGVASARAGPQRDDLTRKLLHEQRRYGAESATLAGLDHVTFGISSSQSPMNMASRGSVLLVGDLRIDNRPELRERFSGNRDSSDADLALNAWLKAGVDGLSWIAGDYALAVFDSLTGILSLVRDPTGQMPLHYARSGDDFAFASMPGGLSPFVGSLEVDRGALAATVCDVRDDDPRSHFELISRVLPGEIVHLRSGGVSRTVHWKPGTWYDDPAPSDDLVEEYRHHLNVAVDARLKGASKPVATHLSSGYDSSAVTATASRLVSNPADILAFTSAPGGPAPVPSELWRIGDESLVASATAQALGVRHQVVRNLPAARAVLRRQSLLFQEPVIAVPNISWLLQIRREAAAAGADCLLTGESGNVSLNTGGLYVLSEWLRQGRWITWARQAHRAAQRPDTHLRGVLYNAFGPWISDQVSDWLRRRYLGPGPSDAISFLRPEWRHKALEEQSPPPKFRNGYEARAHILRNGNAGMLRKAGLAGEGVDERDPFADRRVLEFSFRLSPEQLYWNGVSRPLARAALSDRVPAAVLDLAYRGLQSADWPQRFTRSDARQMLDEISVSPTARELFDLDRMASAIDRWPTENWNSRGVHAVYRQSLLLALAAGTFALVHEQGASPDDEQL